MAAVSKTAGWHQCYPTASMTTRRRVVRLRERGREGLGRPDAHSNVHRWRRDENWSREYWGGCGGLWNGRVLADLGEPWP